MGTSWMLLLLGFVFWGEFMLLSGFGFFRRNENVVVVIVGCFVSIEA